MVGRGQKSYIIIHFMVIKPRHALFQKAGGVLCFAPFRTPPRNAVGAAPCGRPPSVDHDVRRARRLGAPPHRVSPFGRVPFSAAKKEPKRRRGWAPMGVPAHSRATPGPPFTGDTPTPLCKISGAQNTAPGLNSFRATGPWFCAKFRFMPCHRRAWFRPAVAEGAGSEVRRTEPFPRTGDGQASVPPLWGAGEIYPGRKQAGGSRTRPYNISGETQQNRRTGGPVSRPLKDLS